MPWSTHATEYSAPTAFLVDATPSTHLPRRWIEAKGNQDRRRPTTAEGILEAVPGRLRISLLGPVKVEVDGEIVAIAPKPRLLLARLAMNAPRPVSRGALIEALWTDDPPETARKKSFQPDTSNSLRIGS